MAWFRQLSRGFNKFFGRTLPRTASKFGRQLATGARELPSAFKDASRIYSDLEARSKGIPIVPDIFGGASALTGLIGHALGGNVNKALTYYDKTKQSGEKIAPLLLA